MALGWVTAAFIGGLIGASLNARQIVMQGSPPPTALPTGKTYPVSGAVYNSATQQPIPRALVRVQVGPQSYTAFTGADGHFQLDAVNEGAATIRAERPGFSDPDQWPSCNPCTQAASYVVSSNKNEFRIVLTPNGKISGKVVDDDGEPLVGLQVMVERAQISNGRKQFNNAAMASTDDEGNYRIEDCPPGQILISTASYTRGMNAIVFTPRYYPNSDSKATAQVTTVGPGQEIEADFHLTPARVFKITGTVTVAGGADGANVWVQGEGGIPSPVANSPVEPRTGRFSISGVPEGTWKLHAQSWRTADGPKAQPNDAEQEVVVKGANVSGVQINLQQPPSIPVVVRESSGAASNAPANVQVHLVSIGDSNISEYYASPTGTPEPNRAPDLSFQNVQPGRYRVTVNAMGAQACVDSVAYRGSDAGREPITILPDGSSEPLIVNLRNDCGTLNVEAQESKAGRPFELLVIANEGPVEPLVTQTAAGTAMTLKNMTPGEYKVYAAPANANLEYTNPEALRDLPVQEVKLAAGQSTTVRINLPEQANQ